MRLLRLLQRLQRRRQLRRGGARLRLWSARRGEYRELAATCMRADYSWTRPGQDYLDIY